MGSSKSKENSDNKETVVVSGQANIKLNDNLHDNIQYSLILVIFSIFFILFVIYLVRIHLKWKKSVENRLRSMSTELATIKITS